MNLLVKYIRILFLALIMDLDNWSERTELLIGKNDLQKLKNSHVLIAGLGGVGGFAAEILCRAGIGNLTLIDADTFHPSNLNRQIGALTSTIGHSKSKVFESRLKDINPDIKIISKHEFIDKSNIESLLQTKYDFVVDAIDSLAPKVCLLYNSVKMKIPVISSMGAGGKLNPSFIKIADISKSYNDGLARMLRKRLHKLGIYSGFQVVFSPEPVIENSIIFVENERNKKTTLGTISYMPMLFGANMASQVILKIIENKS